MDESVIPECYVDTNLIETLVPDDKYNHQKGCGTVTRVMQEKFADRFAVGIIDRDKKEVEYLKEFNEVHRIGSLILHKHPTRHHYIVQIVPAMERFILHNAAIAGISLADYNLPTDLNLLMKTSKTVNTKDDKRFKSLFKALRKAGAEDITRLAAWVKLLKEQKYRVDVNALKGI